MTDLDVVLDNALTAPVLAFLVGVVATSLKADAKLPGGLYPVLSTYLLLAIGLKGGVAINSSSFGELWRPLLATAAVGLVTPLLAFGAMRSLGRVGTVDAALAAHYGSVSVVTFTVAQAFLDQAGVAFEGFLAALLALLEVSGIVVALLIAQRATTGDWGEAMAEVFRGRSVVLLVGGLLIGGLAGPERLEPVDPLFVGLFTGVLALFLLEMGTVAAGRLGDLREAGWRVVVLAVLVPVTNGALGALAGRAAGLSVGGITLLGTLAGSASYIAAPAAVRIALPEARPGLYVTTSLGVTFPFNILVGIPIYYAIAQAVA